MESSWEEYISSRFPGYLLPESASQALSVDEAARFLEAISGRRDQLDLLRAVSLFAPRMSELKAFVADALVDLVRNLPSRTERVRREWEGGFQGRLSVPETLDLHMVGRRTTFVTQSRKRHFDLPENLVVRATCERLLAVLTRLRLAKAMPETGWGTGARECEGIARRLLSSTALRDVPAGRVTIADENAARAARHPAYRLAVTWAGWMRDALDDNDPEKIARVVADGALVPLAHSTRFELAVVIRLGEALLTAFDQNEPGRWKVERSLVIQGRKDVFAFLRDDGLSVRIFYNQSVLPAGDADSGGAHYLGNTGRLRPDVTTILFRNERPLGAFVVECKLSEEPAYILSGFHEAVLYRWEYASHLLDWPKAILVTSGSVQGAIRTADSVLATTWARWPPIEIVHSLVSRASESL